MLKYNFWYNLLLLGQVVIKLAITTENTIQLPSHLAKIVYIFATPQQNWLIDTVDIMAKGTKD